MTKANSTKPMSKRISNFIITPFFLVEPRMNTNFRSLFFFLQQGGRCRAAYSFRCSVDANSGRFGLRGNPALPLKLKNFDPKQETAFRQRENAFAFLSKSLLSCA